MATNHSYGQEMLEKYQMYKKKVTKAIDERKIFRIVGKLGVLFCVLASANLHNLKSFWISFSWEGEL